VRRSWGAAVFEAVYAGNADPWGYEKSAYEAQKYRATLRIVGRRRFAAGFEAGCSIGVLTGALGRRCKRLLAVDCASAALAQARRNTREQPHISFGRAMLPKDWPRGQTFDLIVFSEILYYLSPADARLVARRCAASLRPGGQVVLVNWTGPTDSPQTGARAAAGFALAAGLARAKSRRGGRYRIDSLTR
jgi:2-polyprenyl-3-methyl-5-hydroxy-6-metoxy-1,4-benzoquinol methylase